MTNEVAVNLVEPRQYELGHDQVGFVEWLESLGLAMGPPLPQEVWYNKGTGEYAHEPVSGQRGWSLCVSVVPMS